MTKWVAPIVILGVIVVLGAWFGMTFISISNQDVDMHTQFNAEVDNNKIIYDKTWKVVKQMAGVTDQYANKFKEIYTEIMDKRYDDNKNLLMKWIQESNPVFDASMYKDINLAIQANKAEFLRCQQKQIDLNREHENLRLKFPSNIFLSMKGCKPFEVKLITSTRTDKAFEDGKDDDVSVF